MGLKDFYSLVKLIFLATADMICLLKGSQICWFVSWKGHMYLDEKKYNDHLIEYQACWMSSSVYPKRDPEFRLE